MLTLAATPIGNSEDTTARLRAALESAEIIAAEDTRRLRSLAARLDLRLGGVAGARLISYFDGNEQSRAEQLLDKLRGGHDVLLVTEAGMPAISDPGYRLVTACVEMGITVTVLPGPSAVTAALALSGLPTDRFCFEGFPPRKGLSGRLAELSTERRTMVFFEAPHRLAGTLAAMAEAFGPDRRAAACRDLTKVSEEVRRAPLGELAEWAAGDIRGEIVLVVAGLGRDAPTTQQAPQELRAQVSTHEADGLTRKQAIQEVARRTGLPKREVYDAVHKDSADASTPEDPENGGPGDPPA
ncbi:16S rRNA (cytidine(1402)-2'-O)-methyltransferase [Lipingzhangella sp. LS1_29]|uniref:Ribosomal RNA small subunit methyltransferase I n=1 Tax=Lipingzhangella rawalii TaxID=2055835 RepID=A0ABU2H4Z2_9ACTN|nr:16S rRNA (cytidine(1402)-2'-O)-methyltransferase [Lipingzhangella rawalii]MDS1270363.1 16S rRNA (cytidine(1402)-2'-O)-methyltransferase [Lipingzhangella rawalii]